MLHDTAVDLQRIVAAAKGLQACTSRPLDLYSKLQTSGRQPDLRTPVLTRDTRNQLLYKVGYQRLRTIETALHVCMSQHRSDTLLQYKECVQEMRSLREAGIGDEDVESSLVESFEVQYRRYCQKAISIVLDKALPCAEPHSKEKANGFTQASLPLPPLLSLIPI